MGVQAGKWLAFLHTILQWRAGAHANLLLACAYQPPSNSYCT
jgi:hypothetical protein